MSSLDQTRIATVGLTTEDAKGRLDRFGPNKPAAGFTPMPAGYFAYLSAATVVYLLIVQVAKGRLFRQAGPATSIKVGQKLAVATQ
jgi:hypothetical protein